MSKLCIFDKNKICNDCGECDVCDLNSSKKCNNCGKCLELEGYDIKAIQIDEVFDNAEDENLASEYEELNKLHNASNKLLKEDEVSWEYIDDIKDLKDLIEEEGGVDDFDLIEEFPGLLSVKIKNKEEV